LGSKNLQQMHSTCFRVLGRRCGRYIFWKLSLAILFYFFSFDFGLHWASFILLWWLWLGISPLSLCNYNFFFVPMHEILSLRFLLLHWQFCSKVHLRVFISNILCDVSPMPYGWTWGTSTFFFLSLAQWFPLIDLRFSLGSLWV